ncbi:hypothetical protein N7462_008918 [Penicillium macrosclerotiorum]|uniref:uncharacterized protein n=1 Tax=Penicillium macrosclerotiorum TaxID=303699 RepID=UPI0025480C43|nr:uncharacterized protein N7462_008918 [Penicillium macrosclerotiorum]KAJ5676021.1 hypothetical protein N7462_008918 [Penicillium macrosclerotiorum]
MGKIFSLSFFSLLWGFLLILSRQAVAVENSPLLTTNVYQFPNVGSWIEGIAERENGDLLITRTDVPELWSINPLTKTASLVYKFPGATSTVGIAKISFGVFAVGVGTVNLSTFMATPGSFSVWIVDLRGQKPQARLLKAVPEGLSLSGMILYTGSTTSPVLLIADTLKGVVWRMDPTTGSYSIALSDSSMLPAQNSAPIGINGVKVLGNTLYYTSSSQQKFCRVKLNIDGSAAGPFEVVASGFFQDGFAIARDGTAYITTHPQNTVLRVSPQGQTSVFAGNLNSTALAGSTDALLGDYFGEGVLYVTTNGALGSPVNGIFTEPAKVVMISKVDP